MSFSQPRVQIAFPLLLALVGVCFCFAATGQRGQAGKPVKAYALIYGTVWGPDNRPLYGIKVHIRRSSDKKARWELYSDNSGEFAQRVPAGHAEYAVSADLKGYKYSGGGHLRLAQDVIVHIENDERVDIGLHLTQ